MAVLLIICRKSVPATIRWVAAAPLPKAQSRCDAASAAPWKFAGRKKGAMEESRAGCHAEHRTKLRVLRGCQKSESFGSQMKLTGRWNFEARDLGPEPLIGSARGGKEAKMFTSERGDRWICQNPGCGAEVMVIAPSQLKEESNLRCHCGSDMGRSYSAPTVRKLETGEAEELLHDPGQSEKLRASRAKQSES